VGDLDLDVLAVDAGNKTKVFSANGAEIKIT
jgi:hypothetical protein